MKIAQKLSIPVFALVLYACNSSQNVEPSGCVLPPEGFSKSDLIGTWVARRLDDIDNLIIREDGTYKQIIHVEFAEKPDVDYESDWQPWRIEFAESGIPYLHLEGMRLCASNPDIDCEQKGGGERDWNAYNENFYYDFCQSKSILMSGEGILMVLGVSERWQQPPRGIELNLLVNCTDCGGWVYELQEPDISTLTETSPP
ncbi:MAG: hypothetical protein FJ030_16440 [Chloroflexi bacterium]|nr:hypothetical protein [Chloroflexota bacterium]